MARIQDIDLPYLEFAEAAAPGTPAAAITRLYAKADGLLYSKDDAGTETVVSGAGSTPAFVGAKVYRAATHSIANITSTALIFADEEYDTTTFHDNVTNNTRLTVGTTGKYHIGGHVSFPGNATGVRQIWIRLNGATTIRGTLVSMEPESTNTVDLTTTVDAVLTATDYVEIMVYQDSGGALVVGHAATTDLQSTGWIHFLGA